MPKITFQDLRDILLGLEFKMRQDARGFVFERSRPAVRLYLDQYEDGDIVDAFNLAGVRFYLDYHDILSRADFEALLRERTLAG